MTTTNPRIRGHFEGERLEDRAETDDPPRGFA